MALITKNIYFLSLNTDKVPLGHSVAGSEASLGTEELTERVEFNITASDAVASTDIAGFDDLINVELLAEIDTYIAANTGFGIDLSANDVSYNANILSIKYGDNFTDVYLTSALVQFKIIVDIKIYIGSQGAFSETAVRAFATSTTEATIYFDDVVADSYDYEVATDSGFITVVESGNVVNSNPISLSSLVIDTNYWVRIRGNASGFGASAWASNTFKTWEVLPLHFWNMSGLEQNTDNIFGTMGDPSPQNYLVDKIKSYKGTANDATPSGTPGALIYHNVTNNIDANIVSAYPKYITNSAYDLASNVVFTDEFTVIFRFNAAALITGYRPILGHDVSNAGFVYRKDYGRFNTDVGSGTPVLWTNELKIEDAVMIFQRDSSGNVRASNDGGANWISLGVNSDTATMNQMFYSSYSDESNYIIVFDSKISDTALVEFSNIYSRATFVHPTKTTAVNNLTFNAFTDYLPNDAALNLLVNGHDRSLVFTNGDYSHISAATDNNPAIPYQSYHITYNHLTGEYSTPLAWGVPTDRKDVDEEHNQGGIAVIGNSLYHLEMSDHYNFQPDSTIVIKKTGPNFNFAAFTRIVLGNNLVNKVGVKIQYLQHISANGYDCILAQEWQPIGGSRAQWVTLFRSNDNFSSWEKIRVYSGEDTDRWAYKELIYSEDGTIRIIMNDLELTARFRGCYYMESDDTGTTWKAYDGVFSQDVVASGPITKTQIKLLSNNLDIMDGEAATDSVATRHAYYDPSDDTVYCLVVDGTSATASGARLYIIKAGIKSFEQIDFLGFDLKVGGYLEVANSTYEFCLPVKTGSTSYNLYFLDDFESDDGNYKIHLLTTTDNGATMVDGGIISSDATMKHQGLHINHNLHYESNRLLAAFKVNGSGDNFIFLKDIS